MYKAILFAGTSEGRALAEFLANHEIESLACTATEYGGSLISSSEFITVSNDPMEEGEMVDLFNREKPKVVIDATHPHAKAVTSNIKKACEEAHVEYLRVLRQGLYGDSRGAVYVDSIEDAVKFLAENHGKALITTGSKEIRKYTDLENYRDRLVARVLSTAESMEQCREAGFEGSSLISMQGPFSRELNEALLKQYGCKFLVTKASGTSGGFEEKIEAAKNCGAVPIVIGVPPQEAGFDIYHVRKVLIDKFGVKPLQKVKLVGIGAGSKALMTEEAREAVGEAELIIGAGRMIDAVNTWGKPLLREYNPQKIRDYLVDNYQYEKIAVLLSGDSGFYSGAKKLGPLLEEAGCIVEQLPGISSISYFASAIKCSWDDAVVVSNHGQGAPLLPLVRDNYKVFSILGKKDDVSRVAKKLEAYGLNQVKIYVGENLSYGEEKITDGVAKDFLDYENDPLCVIALVNGDWEETKINRFTSRSDDEFIRGKVPMTKEEVRALSVDRLELTEDAICYDVGAGTGSVSIEMALKASKGMVYAIEKKPEAVELIEKNKKKFIADNLEVISGLAPEALADLPAPTHIFIGGSSGNMDEIINVAMSKNPEVRVVINCIAVESIAQAVECGNKYSNNSQIIQLQASRGRKIGGYTLMNGENPISIIAFGGKK